MSIERFEFETDRRGPMARLTSDKRSVTLADWPVSLFEMAEAGVLGPLARAEAAKLQADYAYVHAECGHWVHQDHREVCRVDRKVECLACTHRHEGRVGK